MVHEGWRSLAAEEPRELDLSSRGFEQIDAADDEIHALAPVVHGDGKLVGPVAEPIANEEIATLVCGHLPLPAEQPVFELLDS